ncbi:DoxX family protein [Rhizobium sp. CB3090]|uniref:DoxX family protein n=1 Tax=Rhizobium sp. CB3090 TaxID=3039156 RepID=UPI0024B07831|nr:DoxX family protein [Rhizobium sp. CB3090]WFU10649.1 DoxX family protein [Rhizobium sp. CB3090]
MTLSERLNQYQPYALTLLRVIIGLLFMEHGMQKLFGFPAGGHADGPLPTLMLVQGILEAFGGLAILLGFFTRPVAFILSGNMAVAYFMAHQPKDFFPVNNGGDGAILFCFVFLFLVFAGPGLLAVDNRSK